MMTEGIIYKGIGGFYYVKTGAGLVECKPRGVLRKRGEKPVAGDRVLLGEEAGTPFIDSIEPRTSHFIRPPVANADQLVIVASTAQPRPSTLVLDKLTVAAYDQGVTPVIVVTKTDLGSANEILRAYEGSGIETLVASAETGEGLERLRGMLEGKLTVFCGNSGVGKSTLLNALLPELGRETGEISKKLGRGKHTTREVEIFEGCGGLVADTPGFASLDLFTVAPISKEDLQYDFPEIESRVADCRFTGCAHIAEKGCAVTAALEKGEISRTRYDSYVALYGEAKENERY